jgi:hypothetical protein
MAIVITSIEAVWHQDGQSSDGKVDMIFKTALAYHLELMKIIALGYRIASTSRRKRSEAGSKCLKVP